ncbi:MAG: AAA family ATPase [Saprospiraceae bacterium]
MKISKIKIENWRSIKLIEIDFQDLMIFIGQNNCGKSNILYALLFFFGQIKPSDLDFNGDSQDFFVELTFTNLDENDKRQFRKYLNADQSIVVRKTASREGGSSYHGYVQTPEIDWLKEENIANFSTREASSILPLNIFLPPTGRITRELFKNAQEDYIEANKDAIEFHYRLELGQFLGLKSVAQGIFGEIYFIPAIKSASDELNVKGNALFNQLYGSVIQKLSQHNLQYRVAKEQVTTLVKSLNKLNEAGAENTARPTEISSLENRLQSELTNWNTKIEIEITPPDIDEVFRIGTSIWVDDGIKTDISRKGHGLQRAMIFALIKSYSQILKEERENEENENDIDGEEFRRRSSKSTFFILEEPELYLHPQAQRELFSSLRELSKSNNQIIIATHSSFFADLDLYNSICIIRKNDLENGTKKIQCNNDLFLDLDDRQQFNLTYWINPDRAELFFAKKVILLEGPTDKTVIPYLAKNLDCFRFEYTLIDCGSKDSIPIYIALLNKFQIPYTVVYDRDHQAHKNPDAIASANRSSQILNSKIDFEIGKEVIFENDIEEEIGLTEQNNKSKPYIAIKHISDPEYVIPERLKHKIRQIYDAIEVL